eukprot:3971485-Ditylum_brightwellii.AAC.1
MSFEKSHLCITNYQSNSSNIQAYHKLAQTAKSSAANVAANVENEYAFDEQLVGRVLGGEQDRHERQLFTSVPKQMYKELIYKEQGCQAFQLVNIRGDIRNLNGNGEPIE